MSNFKWKCLICEKEVELLYEETEEYFKKGLFPNIKGGTICINFGYGSDFDQMANFQKDMEWQTCICDECFENKKSLCRLVKITKKTEWELIT